MTDFAALDVASRLIGFMLAAMLVLVLTWLLEKLQRAVSKDDFRQARKTANIGSLVFIALIFSFMANSARLRGLVTSAAGCLIARWIFLLWNVLIGRRRPVELVAYLGTFILYVVSGSVGLAAVGLTVYVVQRNPANVPDGSATSKVTTFTVAANLKGSRVYPTDDEIRPFTASSGQVNFGCEQTVTQQAVWVLPTGAKLRGTPVAKWVNINNALRFETRVSVQGDRVVGSGSIVGRNLDRIFLNVSNCPGGGHGELVVTGEYLTRSTITEPFEATLHGQVASAPATAREALLTLPTVSDVTLDVIVATLKGDGRYDVVELILNSRVAGTVRQSREGLFSASFVKCEAGDCIRVALGDSVP